MVEVKGIYYMVEGGLKNGQEERRFLAETEGKFLL